MKDAHVRVRQHMNGVALQIPPFGQVKREYFWIRLDRKSVV